MPGLVPGSHVLRAAWKDVDGRDKPGHDAVGAACAQSYMRFRYHLPEREVGLATPPAAMRLAL
ncbi:hypothetical protein E4K64_35260 [Bradyrhizobium frederickii]|uniref:Uncharacterized protein n=1 Tax=Bradyrhizobium frederickii TaxID=2560054 RepID=A0A4Y9NNP9_9BRAD|nr:hypothetical protein E4K64_35260 [Bradyrhizobium frederickii]